MNHDSTCVEAGETMLVTPREKFGELVRDCDMATWRHGLGNKFHPALNEMGIA